MTSEPTAFGGLSDTEIGEITDLFNPATSKDQAMTLSSEERNYMRWSNVVSAASLLGKLDGVELGSSIKELIQWKGKCTATSIDIGSWSRDLNGLCFDGYVASLEDNCDDDNNVLFKTFDSLVEYVKGVIAEHAPALTK